MIEGNLTHVGVFAFLFNADHTTLDANYGDPCDESFLQAFVASDRDLATRSELRRGDVLFHTLGSSRREARYDPKTGGYASVHGTDKAILTTVLWDFVDAIHDQRRSVDVEFDERAGRNNIHCITALTLSFEIAFRMDAILKAFPPYFGFVEIDQGNPIQMRLCAEWLIGGVLLDGGTAYTEADIDDDYQRLAGARHLPGGRISLASDLYQARLPILPRLQVSVRGRLSERRFLAKATPQTRELVVAELSSIRNVQPADGVSLSAKLPDGLESVEVPEEKLTRYALNLDHPSGRNKARLFRDLLEIVSDDWRFLAAQIVRGVRIAIPVKVRPTSHGVKYHVDVQVVGRNGLVKTVRTAWIAFGGNPAKLTSVYVADQQDQTGFPGELPPLVPIGLQANERWRLLHDLAHAEAIGVSLVTVPTPTKVGREIVTEGLCGTASVLVADARTGFARWLITSGVGQRHYPSGATVSFSGGSQSIDRAVAFAKQYSEVLRFNGIDSKVERHLD